MAEHLEKKGLIEHLQLESDCRMIITLQDIFDIINFLPPADVVEVVRCKDCKNWEDGWLGYCTKSHTAIPYDGFCSCGERKDK